MPDERKYEKQMEVTICFSTHHTQNIKKRLHQVSRKQNFFIKPKFGYYEIKSF